jgi:UTP--glucose-1-phosphate uridylyltransferase
MSKITTAVFPVGGLGTRFLPATKAMPKEMLPIANKPIIQYAFEEAQQAGIEKFIFVTGRNKNAINNHFDHVYELEDNLNDSGKSQELENIMSWMPKAGQICFVRQQKPLGLGHAVACAQNFLSKDEPFVVILADELLMPSLHGSGNFLAKMLDFYYQQNHNCSVVGVDSVEKSQTNKYGIIAVDGNKNNNLIVNMVEKPSPDLAPSNLAIIGRYILQPKIFEYLAKTKQGKGNEIQLTDAMQQMCQDQPFYYQQLNHARFDCGSVLGYIEANIAFAVNNHDISNEVKKIITKYL